MELETENQKDFGLNASDHLPAGAAVKCYSLAAYFSGAGQVYCVVRQPLA